VGPGDDGEQFGRDLVSVGDHPEEVVKGVAELERARMLCRADLRERTVRRVELEPPPPSRESARFAEHLVPRGNVLVVPVDAVGEVEAEEPSEELDLFWRL
jgi:hypothetical protein